MSDPISRLRIGRQHILTPGLTYRREGDMLNLRLDITSDFTLAPFQVNNIKWYQGFSGPEAQSISDSLFFSVFPRLKLDMSYKWLLSDDKTMGMVGGQAWASADAHSSNPPLKASQEQAQREGLARPEDIGREPEGAERLSGGGEAYMLFARKFHLGQGVLLDSSLRFGMGGERDLQGVTVNGLWPVTDQKFWDIYTNLSLRGELFFLNNRRLSVPFYLDWKQAMPIPGARQPRDVRGGLGLRWYVNDKYSLELMFDASQTVDPVNRSENTTVNGAGIFRF